MNQPVIKGFDDEIRFTFYKDTDFIGYIDVFGDRVSAISLGNGFSKKLDITLQQAIDLLGMPQSVLVARGGEFEAITLLNPLKGIDFYCTIDSGVSEITPETEVTGVIFFDPHQYQKLLNSGMLSFYTLTADETLNRSRTWNGYGDLSQYEK
jgi:hypothetical protein